MRKPAVIPRHIRELQRAVANPEVSAWVAANAGSGKTHVLAQRVINLLLQGVEPEKILCITFTKAAAANMAKRVFDTLAEWTTLADGALDAAIRSRSDIEPNAARRAVARRLFARALEVAITNASDQSFRDAIRAAIAARESIARWVTDSGGVDGAIAALSRQLGLEPGETREDIEDESFSS